MAFLAEFSPTEQTEFLRSGCGKEEIGLITGGILKEEEEIGQSGTESMPGHGYC